MSLLAALRYRLRALLHPEAFSRELSEEIDFHLSLDTMQGATGDSDPDSTHRAQAMARRRFGNVTQVAERTREMSGLGFTDMARQDIRFALRTFRQSPGFTAVALLTIALGLGATTAIFSVVDAVMLRPLAYPAADRIVMVWMDNRRQGNPQDFHSYPNYADLKTQSSVLTNFSLFRQASFNLTGTGEPERVIGGVMTADGFAALGVAPVTGRMFGAESEASGNDGVALLSYGFWQSHFGGDKGVVGRELELNGRKRTIIGVMPRGFAFPSEQAALWVPLVIPEQWKSARSMYAFPAIARLKPGVSLAGARTELSAIAQRLEKAYPENKGYGVSLVPLPEQVVGPTLRTTLWTTLGAVAAVLLIACANVANLLLSRASTRQREVTVRMALGASRPRLIRQMLTESLLLSVLGGAAGIALATGGLRVLRRLAPADFPRMENVGLNGTVLLVAALATLVTGLLFGLVPALRSSRSHMSETLREGGRGGTAGQGGTRLRRVIVGAQLALVVVLLTGAALLVRTFVTLQRTNVGFDPDHLLTMNIQLPGARYGTDPQILQFYQTLTERVRAIPGVVDAATVTTMMLSNTPNSGGIVVEGRTPRPEDNEVPLDQASPDFFKTVGARIVEGRAFTAADREGAPLAAVINEHMARTYWPGVSPVGKRFRFGSAQSDTVRNPWTRVVGIVGDMRRTGVDLPVRDEAFIPLAQYASAGNLLIVKTAREPMTLAPSVIAAVHEIDRLQPVSNVKPMTGVLSSLVAQRRFSMTLVAAFALLALVLAAIGAYGVTSYLVSQRTKEMGVRLALGAEPRAVIGLVVRDGMTIAAAGIAVGVVGALLTTRLAASLLYGVSPRDPLTIGGVAAFLLVVVAAANYLPARRASRVDPLEALRQD